MRTSADAIAIAAFFLLAACARDRETPATGGSQTEYSAVGQEPGWALRIDRERISYTGDYGATRVTVSRPLPVATSSGQRYATSRLVVDIVPGGCNDAMSGKGFEDTVIVSTGGRTVRGCGGNRAPERGF